MMFSSIAWLICMLLVSVSGSAEISRLKLGSPQLTNPSGARFFTTFFSFFGSSPAFAISRAFSVSCSGACATTVPAVS
jgi:hypothetical protein